MTGVTFDNAPFPWQSSGLFCFSPFLHVLYLASCYYLLTFLPAWTAFLLAEKDFVATTFGFFFHFPKIIIP